MKTFIIIFISLSFLLSCSYVKKKQKDENNKKIDSSFIIKSQQGLSKLSISQLNGVWAENEEENANFKINNDSMYFIEDYNNPSYIRISNDTLITYYDEFVTKDKVLKLTKDSLILLNEVNDTIKLYKRK